MDRDELHRLWNEIVLSLNSPWERVGGHAVVVVPVDSSNETSGLMIAHFRNSELFHVHFAGEIPVVQTRRKA